MRSVIIIALTVLVASAAQAQVKGGQALKGQATRKEASSAAVVTKSEVQAGATNAVSRSLKNPNIVYSGMGVQAVKSRAPLQLINPLAPANYGTGERNITRDPANGRVDGWNLLSISFW